MYILFTIDECELSIDECTDICTNTEGAYECSCYPGGTLRPSDNKTCDIMITGKLITSVSAGNTTLHWVL